MTEPPYEAPVPAGIGNCRRCPFLETGTSVICYRCARETIEPLVRVTRRCPVCDLAYETGEEECRNPLCSWPDRYFEWNFAVAMKTGVLHRAIGHYKYENRLGWRIIFGRVLLGFLNDQEETFEDFDLIVANPTFIGEGGRDFDHTRDVLRVAASEARGAWPFDLEEPAAIIKTSATKRLMGRTWAQRREIAEGELRAALSVPRPERVRNRSILVYDDVFTDGFTLREVARALREAGADQVCGITLARQPFRRR